MTQTEDPARAMTLPSRWCFHDVAVLISPSRAVVPRAKGFGISIIRTPYAARVV